MLTEPLTEPPTQPQASRRPHSSQTPILTAEISEEAQTGKQVAKSLISASQDSGERSIRTGVTSATLPGHRKTTGTSAQTPRSPPLSVFVAKPVVPHPRGQQSGLPSASPLSLPVDPRGVWIGGSTGWRKHGHLPLLLFIMSSGPASCPGSPPQPPERPPGLLQGRRSRHTGVRPRPASSITCASLVMKHRSP